MESVFACDALGIAPCRGVNAQTQLEPQHIGGAAGVPQRKAL